MGIARTRSAFRFSFPVWGGINGCAAAGILPGGDAPVWGVVYEIPQQWVVHGGQTSARTLDEIEDEGRDYVRGPIDLCWASGQAIGEPVHSYHPRMPRSDLLTDWHYVRHILAGAQEHQLPTAYQSRLASAMIDNNPALAQAIDNFLHKGDSP